MTILGWSCSTAGGVWLEGLHRLLGGEWAAPAWGRAEKSSSEESGRDKGKAWQWGKCAMVGLCMCVHVCTHVPVWGVHTPKDLPPLPLPTLHPSPPTRRRGHDSDGKGGLGCCNCVSFRTRGHQRLAGEPCVR